VIASFDREQGPYRLGSLHVLTTFTKHWMALCNLPPEQVRVVQVETGGLSAARKKYPSMIAGHASSWR